MTPAEPDPPVGGYTFRLESVRLPNRTVWRYRVFAKDGREVMASRPRQDRARVVDRARRTVRLFGDPPT